MAENSRPLDDVKPSDAGIDPVTGLHRMSKTAGVGLQDYAEVSPFAVWSMVLGLASWLVFFGPVLFVVPALGLVLGVIALARIARSNGTQTGYLPATLGVVLAAGLSGFAGYQIFKAHRLERADQQSIVAIIEQLDAAITGGRAAEAYELFDRRFQARVPREQFEERLAALQSSPAYGRIVKVGWNGILRFETAEGSSDRMADTLLLLSIDSKGQVGIDRQRVLFVLTGDGWRIRNIPTYFPEEPKVVDPRNPPG